MFLAHSFIFYRIPIGVRDLSVIFLSSYRSTAPSLFPPLTFSLFFLLALSDLASSIAGQSPVSYRNDLSYKCAHWTDADHWPAAQTPSPLCPASTWCDTNCAYMDASPCYAGVVFNNTNSATISANHFCNRNASDFCIKNNIHNNYYLLPRLVNAPTASYCIYWCANLAMLWTKISTSNFMSQFCPFFTCRYTARDTMLQHMLPLLQRLF